MIVMILASFAHSVPYLLVIWMLGQVALNFIVAPMVAWIDMAPENGRGTASSAYGGLGWLWEIMALLFLVRCSLTNSD